MNNTAKMKRELTPEEIHHEELMEELERTRWRRYWHQIKKSWPVYVMLIPVILFFYFFRYRPIGGILVAFKNYDNYAISIGESDFYGLYAFRYLIVGPQAERFWQAFPQYIYFECLWVVFRLSDSNCTGIIVQRNTQ